MTMERNIQAQIDGKTFIIQLRPSDPPLRRGDAIIVRDVIEAQDGARYIRLVTEDALREVAHRVLTD